ncbi:MAG TPA: maleylpyruvate isomerase family mycothiol-dependent enzyme [Ornithinibacter sp.]|nr:maleylpyruvate isomerase family mycothiol-dependent enzyme [Ornithinibacter sp.]
MSVHPPAPSDLGALVDAYAQTVRNVIDLGRTTRPGDESLPTDCPGWTVLDQVAHVASTEAMVAGEPEPDVDVSHHEHVRHAFGERIERYVESRRGRDLAEVLDELEERLEERLRLYRSGAEWAERPVAGPFGPTTMGELLKVRVFDIWIHEQDIREALGRPGGLDTGAAAHSVAQLFAALPRIVARTAAIEPGNAVVLDLTGPTVGRAGARVEDQDGKAVGLPLFTGGHEEHPDVVTTSLTMSTQVAGRLAGGRRAPEDLHVVVHGDEDVARRVLAALTITP